MVSLPEDSDILHEDPSIHLASRSLLCANALFVRKNLPDQGHLPYKSRIEVMADGLRVLFCRTIDPNTSKDKKLESAFKGNISAFHKSYTPVNLDNDQAQTPKDNELPTDNSALDCRIRGSTAAIADNIEYQIEPDENLRALGVYQISIEMQGSVYLVNIITAQGANTITLSPDEFSGLVTDIATPARGINTSTLELLAKLAIAKTKEWILSQYNYDPDKTQTDEAGVSVAKRSPHLELLPLGANCRQYGRRDYEDQMLEKFGTTPGELNDALVVAQMGWDNLKTMPPHIAKMVEELVLRAMERGEKSGYQVVWEDQPQSVDPVLYQNGQRVVVSEIDTLQNGKKYEKNRHFFQVSFVPGIDDGQRRQATLKLQFPEIAQAAETPQSGTIFTLS